MRDLLLVGLVALASHRATRFLVADRLTYRPRVAAQMWFEQRWEAKYFTHDEDVWQSQVAYLLSCMWCLGFWVAGIVTLVTDLAVGLPYPVLVWLAASTVTGWIGARD
jgi:hypothetical protein